MGVYAARLAGWLTPNNGPVSVALDRTVLLADFEPAVQDPRDSRPLRKGPQGGVFWGGAFVGRWRAILPGRTELHPHPRNMEPLRGAMTGYPVRFPPRWGVEGGEGDGGGSTTKGRSTTRRSTKKECATEAQNEEARVNCILRASGPRWIFSLIFSFVFLSAHRCFVLLPPASPVGLQIDPRERQAKE